MTNDPKFPIYLIDNYWTEDGKDGDRIVQHSAGLIMSSDVLDSAGREELIRRSTEGMLGSRESKNPDHMVTEIGFSHYETWYVRWFSHRTIDVGQTDEEALRSFEDFVLRTEVYHERRRYLGLPEDGDRFLMGAEDRWRWGAKESGDDMAPCRCDGCKKNGVLTIVH